MKRKISSIRVLLFFAVLVLSTNVGVCRSERNAREPTDEIVYFTDGSVIRGFILQINMKIIRIALTQGTVIERPVALLYRFYSKRHFSEIYRQSLEVENRKFGKNSKD